VNSYIGLIALLITVFSGFIVLRKAKLFKELDNIDLLIAVFILGFSCLLIPLLFVGIFLDGIFKAASYIILFIAVILLIIGITKSSQKSSVKFAKDSILSSRNASIICYFMIFAIVLFLFKYAFILSIKGIFDWDATSLYLPFGRSIFQLNHIPLVYSGYQTVTLPMGQSVLYAWAYTLSNSPYSEGFRLFPLLFVFVNILIIFKLTKEMISKEVACIAVIIYSMLPMHDADLWYATYYADPLYNVLILSSFFFIYKYVRNRKISYCMLGGLAMGLAALVKAQFLFLLPATLFIFIILIDNRILRTILTYIISATIAGIFIFVVWPSHTFLLDLNPIAPILATLLILTLTSLVVFSINSLNARVAAQDFQNYKILKVLKDALSFYVPMGIVAGTWYLRNYLLTGSILWDNFFNNVNYHWAQNFIISTTASVPTTSAVSFFFYIVVIPFTSYALGTLWFVPKVIGLIKTLRNLKWSLFILIWILGFLIGYFWSNFYEFQKNIADPRGLYPLAPLLCIFIAIGIVNISSYLSKNKQNMIISIILFSFGFLSLSQSSLIFQFGPSYLRNFFVIVSNSLGSSLGDLAGKVPNYPELLVLAAPRLLLFSLSVSVIILGSLFVSKLLKSIQRVRRERKSNPFHLRNLYLKVILFIFLFMLILLPYILMAFEFSNGDINDFGEDELNPLDWGLYTNVASYIENITQNGDVILTLNSASFQYYLNKNVTVLDLSTPGDLAVLRNAVESDNVSLVVNTLHDQNIRYVILPSGNSPIKTKLSEEGIFIDVLTDPLYFAKVKNFGSWIVYDFIYDKLQITQGWAETSFLTNWTVVNGNAKSFIKNSSTLSITVPANRTVSLQFSGMPIINTSVYPFLAYNLTGSTNARFLFRLFTSDEKISYDFPYWAIPPENWSIYSFNLAESPIANSTLSYKAFLNVQSVDQYPATIDVSFFMIFKYDQIK
jgi:hypothetical protein